MGLTVTEDTPADMLAGSMELLVQLPPDHHIHTQRVTVERSTAMMDLLVQIATAHKLAASSYTLQAIGERGLVLPHQSNTPIGALDALEVKLLPKQGTFIPRKTKQPSQPFETTFRLQVHLPRNQLYVSRVSPKTNLGDILDEVCREKNLDKNKYELRHPGNHKETLDLSLSLQDYHLQEVTLYAKQGQNLGSALSSQDIMALQRQEERRRQQAKQSVFGFIFKKSKESSLSTDSLGGRSVSPARSDETGRSVSPLTVPTRPQRKRRPAPNPPTSIHQTAISPKTNGSAVKDESKEKLVISHSRNSSDSSGYHEASVLSDNPDSAGRMPETLPRRSKPPGKFETRKLAQTSQTSKSLCNLATNAGAGLTHAISNTSLSSTGIRKKRAAPKPPTNRPLSSAISIQALERIVDSEESLTSDMGISKPPSDIAVSSETETNSKANSDISMNVHASTTLLTKNFLHNGTVETDDEKKIHHTTKSDHRNCHMPALQAERIASESIGEAEKVEIARVAPRGVDGSRTVTDLLLQEVSTTLANVSPTSERLSQDVASNEVNYVEETDRIDSKTDVTQADTETGSDSAPNTTVHSQQNTSDYVSATGEDLSAADWEYQLPDPPSAFRDNVARDREVYDTIALSSTDAFREPIITQTHPMENNANSYENAQRKSQDVIVAVPNSTLSKTTTYLMNEKSDEHHPVKSTIEEDVITPRLSPEDRQKSSDEDLRKDVICELSNKIENRISNAPNCKNSEEEYRQSANHKSAPEIAPTENTLPNFKITTYPRQKSSNMYEPLAPMSSYLTDRSQDRIINTFATLSRNMSAIPTKKESYLESSHRNYHLANHNKINDAPITRTHSVHHINSTSEKFVDPIQEVIQIPIKERDFADNVDKNNVVHRSKSYIVLSHNSKYRGKKILVPNATDEGRMLKSTSVTSLNHESAKVNEETVQNCNANTQICQNGKREDRELQSVQILKSILPQLKTNQQFDRVIPGDAATKCHTEEKKPTTQSEDTDEVQLRNKTGSGIEEKKTEPQVTDKRWRYTGPPAISLGSWSERPCVNVKIKMDTDYKFGINNNNNNNISTNNSNITGAKTVVNLNSTSNDVDIVNYKDSFMKNVPKNDVKLSSNDTKEPNIKRMADDVGAAKKKITNTTLNQMESGPNNFGFAKLRTVQRETRDKPVVVNDAATKKSHLEEADTKDDDIKIDTRPVNFKELTQTFGQVNLRVKPKCYSQNRHSDYFDARPSGNDLVDNRIAKISTNDNINGIHRSSIKRYTSVIGIDAQSPTNLKKKSDEIKKIHMTTTNVNGPIPIVKGFKINHPTEIPRVQSFSSSQKNSFAGSNKIYSHNPPPPPTMPVITGVTLKSHNAAMKPVSSCTDPRDELLESIRSFRRDKMRSVDTVF